MNANVKDAMRRCTEASDEERVSFGEVVATLMQAGVERYHTDLVRAEKTYYLPDGSSEMVPSAAIGVVPALAFSAAGVEAAVRAVQAGDIQYRAFCAQVMAAGCVGYLVSMTGRCVVYYGRTGESHVERFPAKA